MKPDRPGRDRGGQAEGTCQEPEAGRAGLHTGQGTNGTRVSPEPLTGRSHQLGVHLQALGHPILGDALYADAVVQARADRLLLHACGLRLSHPVTGEPMQFDSAPPF